MVPNNAQLIRVSTRSTQLARILESAGELAECGLGGASIAGELTSNQGRVLLAVVARQKE